jgi:hypothetical protein
MVVDAVMGLAAVAMTEDGDPPPDLAEFVARHGGLYSVIPREAWAELDYLMSRWQGRRRLAYGPSVVRRP